MFITQKLRQKTSLAFVYVPKTSGTYLNIKSIPDEKAYVNGYRPSSLPGAFHMPTSKVQKIVGDETPLFTILRHPYDRTCSEYYFIKREVEEALKGLRWDINDPKTIKWLSYGAGRLMGQKAFQEKTYSIYQNKMTVEDYLEWTTMNPTYPIFYDTKTPKDFELVGLTENIDKTIYLLKELYGIDSGNGSNNENSMKKIGKPYDTKYSRSEFETKNAIEHEMYYEGVNRFNETCKELSLV
jgi:hypothetical protein